MKMGFPHDRSQCTNLVLFHFLKLYDWCVTQMDLFKHSMKMAITEIVTVSPVTM